MEQYEAWKALLRAGEATGWQEFYVKFYQAFIDGSRWKQYLNGVGTTLLVTAMALAIGMNKDNTALLEAVNGALKELTEDGTIPAIVEKYIPTK